MVNLNLLSKEEKEKGQKKEQSSSPIFLSAVMILIIVSLIILSFFIYQNARKYKISGLDKRIDNLKKEIKKVDTIVEDGKEISLEEKAKTTQNQLVNLRKIVSSHSYWSFLLTELVTHTHREVQYEKISVEDNNLISIAGNSSSYVNLAYFLTSLNKSDKLENARLYSANLYQKQDDKIVINFVIKLSLSPEALQKEEEKEENNNIFE